MPSWETDFQAVERLTPGDTGLGSQFRAHLKMPGAVVASTFTLTGYEPNQRVAFEGERAGPMKPVGSYLFESVANGTRVTARPAPQPLGLFRLMAPLMAGAIEKQNEAHLAKLKAVLED
jgi:hypothetical protein